MRDQMYGAVWSNLSDGANGTFQTAPGGQRCALRPPNVTTCAPAKGNGKTFFRMSRAKSQMSGPQHIICAIGVGSQRENGRVGRTARAIRIIFEPVGIMMITGPSPRAALRKVGKAGTGLPFKLTPSSPAFSLRIGIDPPPYNILWGSYD